MLQDLSLHLMDIAQNSIVAEATLIEITIVENDKLIMSVRDNGCGMSDDFIEQVRNPFTTTRTTRKVGLGIPLLEQLCGQCNGELTLESEVGKGTYISACMEHAHIDRPPLGDVGGVAYMLIVTNIDLDFIYTHTIGENTFVMNTLELKELLEGVPLNEPSIMQWIKDSIVEGLDELR